MPRVPARRLVAATAGLTLACTGLAMAAGFSVTPSRLTALEVSGGVPARTCTLSSASADADVDQAAPGANSGSSPVLRVAPGSAERRALVRFDLAACAIPAGAVVRSADLTLRLAAAPGQPRRHAVHALVDDWAEGAVTWDLQPAAMAAATADGQTGTIAGGGVSWSVTPDVQAHVDGSRSAHGWRISDEDAAGGADAAEFHSREAADPAMHPALHVTYHP